MNPSVYVDLVDDPIPFLTHDDGEIRRLAVSACVPRMSEAAIAAAVATVLESDPLPRARAEAAEALGVVADRFDDVTKATNDPEAVVREAAVTALGEQANPAAVPSLIAAATADDDKLVREAAIAALGAIGDPAALPVLLETVGGATPQLRRRAVVALSVFDGPEVEAALRAAAKDRNPMVREAAEMVVGRPGGMAGPEPGSEPGP